MTEPLAAPPLADVDTPSATGAAFAGGFAIGCAGVAGIAYSCSDDLIALIMAAFAFGLVVLALALEA